MKKLIPAIAVLFLMLLFPADRVAAQSQTTTGTEPYTGQALCLPGAYPQTPADCLPLGPSAFLSDLAKQGISYPFRPLVYTRVDPTFNQAPTKYLKVTKDAIPIYSSLEAAEARTPTETMEAGMKYLAIKQRLDKAEGIYYMLENGQWVEAGEAGASCCITQGRSLGLVFDQNPRNSFGWIIDQVHPRVAPGYQAGEIAEELPREAVVQIYDKENKDNTDWYMVGINQWIERRYIRQFNINTTAPKGVDNSRWIEVNLYEQTLGVYENGRLMFATLIASGMEPFYTKPGLFHIREKKPLEDMRGAFESDRSDYYFLAAVPWTMYYDDARALHGAYWRAMYGYPQSHGCVNLSIGDSKWLYDWAKEGDWVYVWDPSGLTPTDEKFYTQGGA